MTDFVNPYRCDGCGMDGISWVLDDGRKLCTPCNAKHIAVQDFQKLLEVSRKELAEVQGNRAKVGIRRAELISRIETLEYVLGKLRLGIK